MNRWFAKYLIYYPVTLLLGEFPGLWLRRFKKTQHLSAASIKAIQNEQFLRLIKHARSTTTYYQQAIPSQITSLNQLAEISLLEKDTVRYSAATLISKAFHGLKRVKTTGGSTGAPVTIIKNNFGMARELAATWRGYAWAGIDIGDKQARFWGVPLQTKARTRAKLIDFVTNRLRLSAFSFSDEDLHCYVAELQAFKPIYFYGYVSMLRQFAEFIERNKIRLDFPLRCIITTSEVLTEPDRKFISRVFGCDVYNEYGCGEIGTIAHECKHGNMHINAENMLVEIIDVDGCPVKEGETGEIVVTDLTNFSMPLIRYRMKDLGAISSSCCPCGSHLPILSNIHGREYDMLINNKGQKFHGEFFLYIFEDAKRQGLVTRGVQLEQTEQQKIAIRIVCEAELFDELTTYVADKLREKFDPSIIYTFEKVTEIKREDSGKIRVIKRAPSVGIF